MTMFVYAKAITAFVSSALLYVLMPFGIDADTTVGKAIEVLVSAGIVSAAVYFTPNKK